MIIGDHDMRLKMYMVYLPPDQVCVGNITKVSKLPRDAYDSKLPYQESYAPGEVLDTLQAKMMMYSMNLLGLMSKGCTLICQN